MLHIVWSTSYDLRIQTKRICQLIYYTDIVEYIIIIYIMFYFRKMFPVHFYLQTVAYNASFNLCVLYWISTNYRNFVRWKVISDLNHEYSYPLDVIFSIDQYLQLASSGRYHKLATTDFGWYPDPLTSSSHFQCHLSLPSPLPRLAHCRYSDNHQPRGQCKHPLPMI